MTTPPSLIGQPNRWRDALLPVRFFSLDARVTPFIALAILHLRLWTALLAALAILAFWLMQRSGLRLEAMPRLALSLWRGPKIPANRHAARRTPVDYGFEMRGWLYRDDREWACAMRNGPPICFPLEPTANTMRPVSDDVPGDLSGGAASADARRRA